MTQPGGCLRASVPCCARVDRAKAIQTRSNWTHNAAIAKQHGSETLGTNFDLPTQHRAHLVARQSWPRHAFFVNRRDSVVVEQLINKCVLFVQMACGVKSGTAFLVALQRSSAARGNEMSHQGLSSNVQKTDPSIQEAQLQLVCRSFMPLPWCRQNRMSSSGPSSTT